jgi:hypothetical protein
MADRCTLSKQSPNDLRHFLRWLLPLAQRLLALSSDVSKVLTPGIARASGTDIYFSVS